MLKIKLLINIDETTTTINKDTKQGYSWLKRVKSWSILNVKFRNSVNLISAIWSDGAAINLLKYCKTNKESIIKFLRFLFDFITKTKGLVPSEVGIVWDNWPPHRAKIVRNFWKEMNVKYNTSLCILLNSLQYRFIFQNWKQILSSRLRINW